MSKYGRMKRIKAAVVGEGVVDVLGCPYYGHVDGVDVDGEYFSPNTDFMESVIPYPPVFYYHGSTTDSLTKIVGDVKARWKDADGIWYRVKLHIDNAAADVAMYARMLWRSAKAGTLFASSGAVDASVIRDDDTGEIKQWLVGELSLIDLNKEADRYPANSYAIAKPSYETYQRMSKSGRRRLFGDTYTRNIPKRRLSIMNEEQVMNDIEAAAFAVFDWYNASVEAGMQPDENDARNQIVNAMQAVLSSNPQLVPEGLTLESVFLSASEAVSFDMAMLGDAVHLSDVITTAMSAAVPNIAPAMVEGEDENKGGEVSVKVGEGAGEGSVPQVKEGAIEPVISQGSTEEGTEQNGESIASTMIDDDEDKTVKALVKALSSPAVLKFLEGALSNKTAPVKSANKKSAHVPADQGFVDGLVMAGTMKEEEQADVLLLFGDIRSSSRSQKTSPIKSIQILRDVVARAYSPAGIDIVGFNGAKNAPNNGHSDAYKEMLRFTTVKVEERK